MIIRRMFEEPRWDWRAPFEEFERLRRLLGDTKSTAGVFPLLNVSEDSEKYYVRAELPGVAAGDIDVTITGSNLAIKGERKIPSEGESATYHRREREAGKFNRVITLEDSINPEKVDAQFKDGVLTISLAKAESSKPRQIAIS